MAEESSQPGELPGDFPSTSPQPGKILEFDILILNMVTDIVVMTAGDLASAQAEEPIMDTGTKDIPVEVSTEKVLNVEPFLKVAT